jgi:effector-binding domain-containing protein
MVLGKNLTTYVKGPQSQIDNAYKAMYQYVTDRNIMMPGIPYEMLMTNRMDVKDSTTWETKIYFPSM